MIGARAACSAATTMDQNASWSHRSSWPVNAMANVASRRSEPLIQFASRGNLYEPNRNTCVIWTRTSTTIAPAPK